MLNNLFKIRMNDGTRHFADMPENALFGEFYERAENLTGAAITEFLTDGVVEMWLDFEFHGHKFSVNNQFGDYWFFVTDPECPDEILFEIIEHFRKLLD